MIPVLAGLGVSLSGLLAAAAIATDGRAWVIERLGVDQRPSRSRTGRRPLALVLLLVGAALGWRLAGPVGGMVGVGGVFVAGRMGRDVRARRRLEEAEEGLADVVRAMAAASRSGRSVRRSLEAAAIEAPPSLRRPLGDAVDALRTGAHLPDVLAGLGRHLPLPDAPLLVGVLRVHLRTGGDLPGALDRVADLVARRQRARRRLRALTAQGRASGAVLALLPVAFVGLLSGMGGNGLGAFYGTAQGSALLAAGLLLSGLGFLWIRRILRRAAP